MKKQLHKLLLLVAAVFFASSGYAYDAEIDGIYYKLNTTYKIAVVTYRNNSYSSYTGDVVIPSSFTYEGDVYSVIEIGDDAFRNCYLSSIKIPKSVRSIGSAAFYNCDIAKLVIPAFVKGIGHSAFTARVSCPQTIYLYAKLDSYECFRGYSSSGKVYAYSSEYKAIRKEWSGAFNSLRSMNPAITLQNISPTSISVKGSHNSDVSIKETGFIDHGSGDILTQNGLCPNQAYKVEYYLLREDGGSEVVCKKYTTEELRLTTLQPRGVSSTCSIVTAETNINEDETNVGFQWKKYDAPASLKPNEGYAAVYDGKLEGYVRNLQSTSYYNVRAFYKSAEGNYYYGDWVTFDPSDFSYFEPTVHTYAATELTHSSARVRGYVLAGTDDIEEQGFEYWPVNDSEVNALRVKAAVTDDSNVQTVLATGQVMTAELRNLRPGTTYSCRAFVKTATRTTYGETQTFTTEGDPTGIDDITIDTPAAMPTVTGYYDLSGRKSDTPHHGVNIVRYSDGTARKVIMK